MIRHRLCLLGLLALTVAAAYAMTGPHGRLPLWLAGAAQCGLAASMVVLWAAWWQADRREAR